MDVFFPPELMYLITMSCDNVQDILNVARCHKELYSMITTLQHEHLMTERYNRAFVRVYEAINAMIHFRATYTRCLWMIHYEHFPPDVIGMNYIHPDKLDSLRSVRVETKAHPYTKNKHVCRKMRLLKRDLTIRLRELCEANLQQE
jgi:hypothetical protein